MVRAVLFYLLNSGEKGYTPYRCSVILESFSCCIRRGVASCMAEKRKKKLLLFADTLSDLYGHQQWGNQWHLYKLVRHWSEIAGEPFCQYSMPAYFRRDELWVYAQNSIWMQQMHLCQTEIVTKINRLLQGYFTVKGIRWALQPAELIDIPEEEYVPPPLDVNPDAEREFRSMAENVANPEAREALCRLWQRMESIKKKS